MTARHTRILADLFSGRPHPPTCVCWLCLWRDYERAKPVGHPYDFLTFLACDIIDEINDEFQLDSVKKIPVKRLATRVIGRLPNIGDKTKQILNEYSRDLFVEHFPSYAHLGRYKADKLAGLREEIAHRIHRRAMRMPELKVASRGRRKSTGDLILKIARFVYSQRDYRATQREIQRHTNKTKAELEALHGWLAKRHGIVVPKHENWESAVYVGTTPVRKPRRSAPRAASPTTELAPIRWDRSGPPKELWGWEGPDGRVKKPRRRCA